MTFEIRTVDRRLGDWKCGWSRYRIVNEATAKQEFLDAARPQVMG